MFARASLFSLGNICLSAQKARTYHLLFTFIYLVLISIHHGLGLHVKIDSSLYFFILKKKLCTRCPFKLSSLLALVELKCCDVSFRLTLNHSFKQVKSYETKGIWKKIACLLGFQLAPFITFREGRNESMIDRKVYEKGLFPPQRRGSHGKASVGRRWKRWVLSNLIIVGINQKFCRLLGTHN